MVCISQKPHFNIRLSEDLGCYLFEVHFLELVSNPFYVKKLMTNIIPKEHVKKWFLILVIF